MRTNIDFVFNQMPNILDILELLERKTNIQYRLEVVERQDLPVEYLKERLIQVRFYTITPIFIEISNFYKKDHIFWYDWEVHFKPESKKISFCDGWDYSIDTLRQVLLELGCIREEHRVRGDEKEGWLIEDLRLLIPIPDYINLPWHHELVPDDQYRTYLRESIGWNPQKRPPFVSQEFIEQIERGMPTSKPRRKK